ncbi:hypothetical protein C2845_PM17G06920 [Panicum miliaceum]|uniref:Uncharacterized protein n=1 Tax=Panicum miliaceum TaxID=4540 RepID=A0A3L6Q3I7_PANMI|nr:hypothetical protein C2845_PM17G06920 [Panicum miliaceum]
MIIPMDIGYDGPLFQVHDMVLSIIKSLSAEQNFVTIVDGQQNISLPKKIRQLSLQFNDSEEAVTETTITSHNPIR